MYICVCKAVSDRRIEREVAQGVTTLRELTRATGLGTCCGKCVPQAREVLMAALAAQAPALLPGQVAAAAANDAAASQARAQ